MTIKEVQFVLSLSVALPVICGMYIYDRADRKSYPFYAVLMCTVLGLLTEIITFNIHDSRFFNMLPNIYMLLEFGLIQYQFFLWNKWINYRYIILSIILLTLFWLLTIFYIGNISQRNTHFNILYSFVLIFTSVSVLSRLVFSTKFIVKNFQFVFCIAILLSCTYSIIVEIFCMYYKLFSEQFIRNIFYIKSILNAVSYILLAISFLCIPKKQQYSLSF